jgi:hypothetical protein
MESIQEFAKLLSFFVWFGFVVICVFHFCRGLIDGKSMIKLVGIIIAIGFGYEVVQIVISNGNSSSDEVFKCVPGVNGIYLTCASWPFFNSTIAALAENMIKGINYFFVFSLGYVQIITAIVIFSKFSKGIWSSDMREIFFAFGGGAIIYVSLTYMGDIEDSFMNMTQYLLGFSGHHGSSQFENSIDEVNNNLQNWKLTLDGLRTALNDQNVFSLDFASTGITLIFLKLMRLIIEMPLLWFSFLNIIMLFIQQFLIIGLPIDAIKMSMSMNVDPFIIIRKLFAISLLSMAVVTEYKFLNWLPTPPEISVVAGAGIAGSVYIGLFISAIIVVLILIASAFFSMVVIFKSFMAGKESIDNLNSR